MSLDVLKKLFEQYFQAPPEHVQPLQGELGGSGRKIIRFSNEKHRAIGILYGVREENAAFLAFSKHFRSHGLPVPEIYAEDLTHGVYLEEDLGDTTLFEFLSNNRTGENIAPQVVEAYRKVVAVLPRFQVEASRDLNYEVCYPNPSFDRQSIAWDLNYFKYYFLRLAGIPFNEHALEEDFTRLTEFLLSAPRDYFLYRDFQSRNIMLRNGDPFFVDYQGGRKGALQYDIASLCTTPRPTSRPICASNSSITISTAFPASSPSIAKLSSATTMPTFISASCKPSVLTVFAVSSNAGLISCKACPMR